MYSNELICNILIYIDNNIKNKISINDLSKIFNYDRYYIMKLFKKELNISIVNYINTLKIYNSLFYINNDHSILSTALSSGFYSQEYYSEIFKKILEINPITYKKIIKRQNVSNLKIDTLNKNLAIIKQTINQCNNYKNNIKPKTNPVIKLSIFNQ